MHENRITAALAAVLFASVLAADASSSFDWLRDPIVAGMKRHQSGDPPAATNGNGQEGTGMTA